MPKVSVVLPNYNYARYLDERIQSILNQSYEDFELIIVDDASKDNSLEVIEKYTQDKRVRTKFFGQNSGLPYKRWNDGYELATGKYVLFAGADDSCAPTFIETLVEKLDKNPSVGIAYAQSWEINSDGQRVRSFKQFTDDLDEKKWGSDYVNDGRDECRYMIVKNTIPNASAALIRCDKFEEAGKFDESLELIADWILYLKLFLISDVAYVAEPLNYFRVHPQTVRSKTKKDGRHILEIVKLFELLPEDVNIPQPFIEKAHDRMANRWVNSIERLLISNPGKVTQRFQEIHAAISRVDPKINRRLLKRALRDIFTFGLLTYRDVFVLRR